MVTTGELGPGRVGRRLPLGVRPGSCGATFASRTATPGQEAWWGSAGPGGL